jgi:maltooligosyltrehalose synthase
LQGLDSMTPEEIWDRRSSGAVKLHFLQKGLALRATAADSFGPDGDYQRLETAGEQTPRILAFQRGRDAVAIVSRFWKKYGAEFGGASVLLPEGSWDNALTGATNLVGQTSIQDILGPFPCAMLKRAGSA